MNDHPKRPEPRRPGSDAATGRNDEETLVIDDRGTLTPSQMVEQKLLGLLKASPMLVSQMQRRAKPGPR